ncbi:MAG TPA: carboxypeptidase regulatory-like domain-containing protein [Bryobacteraceae bacterium]|nr:carboxypeptidase regulatory-like domain-containing protein [Bryobacteraceae bacterium]
MRSVRLLVCLIALSLSGWSQEFRATLTGVVSDVQGAVIPGAKVVATHVDTGAKFNTVSGAEGQYTMPFMNPGRYNISAEVPGFKTYLRENVQLSTNARVTLDMRLEIGNLAESVTVTADATMLTTTSASVGQPITTRQVDSMPMSGRAPMALANLALGVIAQGNPVANSRPFDNEGTARVSMGGSESLGNELLFDGGPNTTSSALVIRGKAIYNPPLDSVQEVKVEMFQSDAAYGYTTGGTVNIVSKGGGNQLHGSANFFNQSSALAATPFFTNRAGGKKTVTRYNQWGATASGPVYIPKLYNGTDRLFFYFAYDAVQHVVPQPFILTVPTEAERNGDFSQLLALGSNYTIYDPATGVAEGTRRRRQPFPDNKISPARLNSIAKNYLSYYPNPNQTGAANGQDNFFAPTQRKDDYYNFLGRVDYNHNKHKLFGNVFATFRTEYINDYFANQSTGEVRPRETSGSKIDHVYMINPTTLLNSRVSYSRFFEVVASNTVGFDLNSLGFPSYLSSQSTKLAMPPVSFSDPFQSLSGATGRRVPEDHRSLFSTLSMVRGAHSMKVGADIRRQRVSQVTFGNSAGAFTFGTNWTRGPLDNASGAPLGQGLASFLLGLPTSGSYDINTAITYQTYYKAFFFQDDWRVTPRLTLNLGLRYEKESPTSERWNRVLTGFDFTTANAVTAAAQVAYSQAYDSMPDPKIPVSGFNPVGGPIFATADHRNIYSTDSNAFSPRFGFAYTPAMLGGKTVLRGGFGIFFATHGPTGINQPGFSQTTQFVPTNDGYLTPNATLTNPFPGGLLEPAGASQGLNTYLGQGITFFNPAVAQPYTGRWTLTVQQQLATDLVVELAYIGSHSLHLPVNESLNFVPAQFLSTSLVRDQATIDRLTANVANPFRGLLPGTNLNGSTISKSQLLGLYPQLTGLTKQSVTEGYSNFHSLNARVEKRLSGGLQLLANASVSRTMEATSRLNASDSHYEYVVADQDRPYRLVLSGSYDLPFGKSKAFLGSTGPWLDRLVGGWTASSICSFQGGAPIGWGNLLYYGGDLNLDMRNIDRAFDTSRFNTTSNQQLSSNIRTLSSRFSNLRSDAIMNFDVSLIKNTTIVDRVNLQFRAESFNVTNRAQFSNPNLSATSANFGKITGQANFPRLIQLGMRLSW